MSLADRTSLSVRVSAGCISALSLIGLTITIILNSAVGTIFCSIGVAYGPAMILVDTLVHPWFVAQRSMRAEEDNSRKKN